jgi:putative serine/threonine protein kinase
LHFTGRQKIGNVNILGKGCVGIVIAAHLDSQIVALKIRRTDANRASMKHEADMLRMANSVGVGPRLFRASENFLAMELLEGELIEEWIDRRDPSHDSYYVVDVLRSVLEQCHRLDRIGLDHGELSEARKHVIIDQFRPYILDFETASTARRPSNLSSICQYLFISSPVASKVKTILDKVELNQFKESLSAYKKKLDTDTYQNVLRSVHLF